MKVNLIQEAAERAQRIEEVERLEAKRGKPGSLTGAGNRLSPSLQTFANAINIPKDEPLEAENVNGVRGRDFASRLGWSPAKFQNAVNTGQIPRPTKTTRGAMGNQYWPEAVVESTVKKLKD